MENDKFEDFGPHSETLEPKKKFKIVINELPKSNVVEDYIREMIKNGKIKTNE